MSVVYTSDDLLVAVDHVAPIFQPVLWLDDHTLAGYEALARGPRDSPLEMPLDLFAAAREGGMVSTLESAMMRATLDSVMATPWHHSVTLFANAEPEAMLSQPTPETRASIDAAERLGHRVVIEITERALLGNPAALIATSDAARSRGWGIAMDDVGAEEDSLTLLWVLQPDVVKLDMSLLHRPFDARAARVSATVREYCDRTGALMVCEGVETQAHESRARALGADLVQGFLYARPGPRPEVVPAVDRPIRLRGVSFEDPLPFVDCLDPLDVRTLPGSQVEQLAAELLSIVSTHTDAAVVIASAPSGDEIPDGYLSLLARLAPQAGLVALIAPGIAAVPADGVVGVDADAADDLGAAWSITVMAPTMAAALLADGFVDGDERSPVHHRILHDRLLVAHGVRTLLSKILTTI